MEEILQEKINELIKFTEEVNEPNSQIVLLALSGAIYAKLDELLANKMKEFIKDVLKPRIEAAIENDIASKN